MLNPVKEMKYQATRINPPEQLAGGEYRGYNYYVLNLGTHPCAYVQLPTSSKYYGKEYDDVDIKCHGGVTYADNHLTIDNTNGWFIGWSYDQLSDYNENMAMYGFGMTGKKHTTTEMVNECHAVIDQLRSK